MFLLTQFIGLFVISSYSTGQLPYGLQTPEDIEGGPGFISIIISFIIAMALIMILIKYKWKLVIRLWFFIVVALAMGITLNSVLRQFLIYPSIAAIIITLPLAFIKIFRPNFFVHNITELIIYPGIAAIFVPILNVWSIIALLIIISVYDMWAVWKSGVMQKMAKFQMEELKIFGGLLIPSVTKKVKQRIKKLKQRYKGKEIPKKALNGKIKVQLAILGGGDIVFPIIAAGVFLVKYNLIAALFVTFGSLAGLTTLLLLSEKKKFYPAMPFISAGIFLGMILWKLLFN
tara:strand:- start:3833 stop:4696 length:864 start_codon:yes stop_codon:yes gene_type:complete